ncbi:SURF1 family protein [Solimonas sp. SE-A11]|uniref:SURF1 family protein n=1 Tax=Solimonas sp. SE-A11 TaxID=3054954 RepID=UPI00259CD443|nr:SURF1 family protein [Solimonas sp. SE-A11]MDM4768857.1 SURF1 family protein [Solimonas sp. SE-A11]
MNYTFRPPWWAWLATAALSALMINLGLWQYHRGQAKEGLMRAYAEASAAAATPFDPAEPPHAEAMLRRSLSGDYLGARQLLLDNQGSKRRAGYHAWAALRLADGSLVMVDRGWVPGNPDRSQLPALEIPSGTVKIEGFWRPLPRPGLRVASDNCDERPFPRVVQYPTQEDLACLYPGERVAPGLLLLAPEAPGGYEREWNIGVEVPPQKHYGYALQWFAFTATLLVLFIRLNLKRRS